MTRAGGLIPAHRAVALAAAAATSVGDAKRLVVEANEALTLLSRGRAPLWVVAPLCGEAMATLSGEPRQVLDLFARMEREGIDPDGAALNLAVSAAASLAATDPSALKVTNSLF